MSKNTAAVSTESTANEIKYSGKAIAESKQFARVMWAALVVLKPDEYYTISEAWNLVSAFLDRKVG